jgi:hypothetical protein
VKGARAPDAERRRGPRARHTPLTSGDQRSNGTPRPAVADEPASRSPHSCGGPGTRHSSDPTRRRLTQALLHQIIGPLTRQPGQAADTLPSGMGRN